MKDETRGWLSYSEENFAVARLSLEHGHLNACLQNAQQSVEKAFFTKINFFRKYNYYKLL